MVAIIASNGAVEGALVPVLRPDGLHHPRDANNVDHARQIVAEHRERHLSRHLRKCLHQEVRLAPIRILMVPNGCSTTSRRVRIASGFRSSRSCTASSEDVYRCPAGEKLRYYYTNEENGQKLRNYWTNACRHCALKPRCTSATPRRIKRWEHEHVLEAVQERLDRNPDAMRTRREVVEHPFGTIKMRMGARRTS